MIMKWKILILRIMIGLNGKNDEPKKIIFVDNLTSINEIESFSNQSDVKYII